MPQSSKGEGLSAPELCRGDLRLNGFVRWAVNSDRQNKWIDCLTNGQPGISTLSKKTLPLTPRVIDSPAYRQHADFLEALLKNLTCVTKLLDARSVIRNSPGVNVGNHIHTKTKLVSCAEPGVRPDREASPDLRTKKMWTLGAVARYP